MSTHAISVVGIDPGKKGYVSALYADGSIESWSVPTVTIGKGSRKAYDVQGMSNILNELDGSGGMVSLVILEKQSARPAQGVVSVFSIGQGYGLWEGLLAGLQLPYITTTPQSWQRVMLAGVAGEDTKGRSIIAAGRLFPKVDLKRTSRCKKPDHNKTDSMLMAYWGKHHQLRSDTIIQCSSF